MPMMTRIDEYKVELAPFLEKYLTSGDDATLRAYLCAESALPGPRGNLELAAAFVTEVEVRSRSHGDSLWKLCRSLTDISVEQAPVNDPDEFLPFCGVWALGALGASLAARFEEATLALRRLARDPRWRMREAVANALQRLIQADAPRALGALDAWVVPGDWLALRAVAAGVAEPTLLQNVTTAHAALALHRRILETLRASPERQGDSFKALRQGLGYTLSVVVAAAPEKGWALLEGLAQEQDADMRWILRENLKKTRLVKRWPERVAALGAQDKGRG